MGKHITLIFSCMALTACATVFDKTNDNISFTSEPSNANISLKPPPASMCIKQVDHFVR